VEKAKNKRLVSLTVAALPDFVSLRVLDKLRTRYHESHISSCVRLIQTLSNHNIKNRGRSVFHYGIVGVVIVTVVVDIVQA
jgi:hypothetical protein